MSRRYDSRTTIFSPEGRLYQVEYAMEAISNAGAAIGVLAKDGVVLAAEKRVISKLLATSKSTEKMYKIDDHVACAVAGIMADANILINTARLQAQRFVLLLLCHLLGSCYHCYATFFLCSTLFQLRNFPLSWSRMFWSVGRRLDTQFTLLVLAFRSLSWVRAHASRTI